MQLNFKKLGENNKEVVFILHGLFGMLDNWISIGKKLSEEYQVYLIDLRNHGKSPHSNNFSYIEMANDIKELCIDEKINKVHLIGHSMGGKTAMIFAREFPDLLSSLIVVDIAPKAYPPHHQQIVEGLLSLDLQNITSRKQADEELAKKIKEYSIRQFLLKNITKRSDGGYQWKMNLNILVHNLDKVIEETTISYPIYLPALFIRGKKSNYILDKDFDRIIEFFPKSLVKTIENSGHWVHAEQPETFTKEIKSFLLNI